MKEERQAEFLVRGFYPWTSIAEVVVHSPAIVTKVDAALRHAKYRPPVVVRPAWYH